MVGREYLLLIVSTCDCVSTKGTGEGSSIYTATPFLLAILVANKVEAFNPRVIVILSSAPPKSFDVISSMIVHSFQN